MRIEKTNEIITSRISHHCRLTPRLHKLVIEKPKNFSFKAGQYIKLFFDDGTFKLYSIANTPDEDTLEFHIQEPTINSILRDFLEDLAQKTSVSISRALGTCISPSIINCPIILIAGGCGFAHSKSIIEDISNHKSIKHPIHLYWGVKSLSDLYYQEYLNHLKLNTNWFNFEIILTHNSANNWKGKAGHATDFAFIDYPNLQTYILFASGPPKMVEIAYRKAIFNKLLPNHFYSDYQIPNTADLTSA